MTTRTNRRHKGKIETIPTLGDGTEHLAARAHVHGASSRSFWAAIICTIAALALLVAFILENGKHVKLTYFGQTWYPPLGIALLVAALIGGLVIVLAVAARVLQLKHRNRPPSTSNADESSSEPEPVKNQES